MTIRTLVEVDATAAAVTSPWYRPDYRFDQNPERAFAGHISSGATFTIQVAMSVSDIIAGNNPSKIVTAFSNTTAGDFTGTIHGSFPAVRVVFSSAGVGTDFVLLSF